MKLFSKKRSLALCAASVALAAAVLLTGCGGSDGGGGGGGSTPAPNPNPVEPVEPEEPDNEWKDVAVPGETVKTENVTMEVEKTNVASNTQVDSEDTSVAYAPFNFKITNTTDKPVDLKETIVQPQSVCNAIALFSADDGADDVDYKNEFNNGHASEHLTVTLKGKAVDATVQIHVYNGLGVEQPNTTILQEKDWYGTFDVVAKVPADWAEKDEPLKVNYNLPAQTGVAEIKADFAVTRDGDKVKTPATLAFKDGVDGRNIYKLNTVYAAIIEGTIENNSETVADLSDFLNADEYQEFYQLQNKYKEDYTKKHENCTDADVQESLVKYIVEIAGENDENYPFYQYLATSIETRNTAKVMVSLKSDNAKKLLKPGESTEVSIFIMSTTAENATLRYNNSALLAVDEQEFKNAGSSETPDTPSDFPTITGPLGGGSYEDTLNNQKGYLLYAIVKAENTTGSPYDTWNTLTSLGITGSEHPKAEQVYAKGIPAKNITATVTTKSGQKVPNLSVIVARQTGTDSKLGVDETDNIFAFCFMPTGGEDWKRIDFYYNGTNIGGFANPSLNPPTDSADIGDGKIFEAVGLNGSNAAGNVAVCDDVSMALWGYRKYASDDSYDYIDAVIMLGNQSENINVPLENGGKSFPMTNGKPDYAAIATSEDFASEYITIENDGYAFGVLSTKSNNTGSNGVDTSTLYPSTQENCTGFINVVIRVPKNWSSSLILKYNLPWTDGRFARFMLKAQDILGDSTSGGKDTDYTPSEDAVNVDLSDSRLSWTFAGKVENTLMVNNWSVSNAYSVKANEEGKFALNDVVQYSDVENFMQTYAKNHASEYGSYNSKDGTLSSMDDIQALAERAIQAALKEGFECKSVKAMVDGVAYPVIACVKGTYEVRNDYSVVVCFIAALPKDAKVYNVKYVCGGTTELGSASYANGSGNTASQKLASLFRAVK